MNSKKLPSVDTIKVEIENFRQQQQTLMLASNNNAGLAEASYAPFVEDENGHLYLLLSGLSSHSRNLRLHIQQQTPVSVMLIQDEQNSRNLFARKRLSYTCQVSLLAREDSRWQPVITRMQDKLGNTVRLLAGMGDFNLYNLQPQQGNYIRGFGQAYKLKGQEIIHQNPARDK
jgi:putative heme iron utilization protein